MSSPVGGSSSRSIVAIAVTAPLLGRYMAHVYSEGSRRVSTGCSARCERLIYRACRVDPEREQRWNVYTLSVLAFSVAGVRARST